MKCVYPEDVDFIGKELDQFVIQQELGAGATATVYRAFIKGTRKEVAVKVLHDDVMKNPTFLKRFHREARLCMAIDHPNVLKVHSVADATAPVQYIVTDLIVGINLGQFLTANEILCPELAVLLILPVLKGLSALHDKGIVHRDIKPANIMVDWVRKRLTITDLGIAQPMDASRLTSIGMLIGSLAFMAPERLKDDKWDHTVDIWAAGTILYWMITKRLPFDANSRKGLIKSIISGRFNGARSLNPMVANELNDVLSLCLRPDPKARYQWATKVRRDLEKFLREQGISNPELELAEYLINPRERGPLLFAEIANEVFDRTLIQLKTLNLDGTKQRELTARVHAYLPGRAEAFRSALSQPSFGATSEMSKPIGGETVPHSDLESGGSWKMLAIFLGVAAISAVVLFLLLR